MTSTIQLRLVSCPVPYYLEMQALRQRLVVDLHLLHSAQLLTRI